MDFIVEVHVANVKEDVGDISIIVDVANSDVPWRVIQKPMPVISKVYDYIVVPAEEKIVVSVVRIVIWTDFEGTQDWVLTLILIIGGRIISGDI